MWVFDHYEFLRTLGFADDQFKLQWLSWLWITFWRKNSSMISKLKWRNHWKCDFSYISARASHYLSARRGNVRFLWIIFERNFSSIISTVKIGDPDKVTFSYISARGSHSLSAQQVHASNQPYKRLAGRPAPKVFGECERCAVGLFSASIFALC